MIEGVKGFPVVRCDSSAFYLGGGSWMSDYSSAIYPHPIQGRRVTQYRK